MVLKNKRLDSDEDQISWTHASGMSACKRARPDQAQAQLVVSESKRLAANALMPPQTPFSPSSNVFRPLPSPSRVVKSKQCRRRGGDIFRELQQGDSDHASMKLQRTVTLDEKLTTTQDDKPTATHPRLTLRMRPSYCSSFHEDRAEEATCFLLSESTNFNFVRPIPIKESGDASTIPSESVLWTPRVFPTPELSSPPPLQRNDTGDSFFCDTSIGPLSDGLLLPHLA